MTIPQNFSINCKGRLINLSSPKVMGIINCTPDSFYKGSRLQTIKAAVSQAENMLAQGATLLDVGGMSSRPGAQLISAQEECERVIPVIKAILKEFSHAIISIDTIYAETAKQAIQNGAAIVNDISGGLLDENMVSTVAELNCPYIAMHMRGTPATMKSLTNYDHLIVDIVDYFIERTERYKEAGIKDIIIDPGFGFAKTIEQNFELLNSLSDFQGLNFPLLVGVSRKSMIWKTLNRTADDALNGTTALNMFALQQGANLLRVHDVREAIECVQLYKALKAND